MKVGKVIKVSGPLVVAEGMEDANVYDVVEVSDNKLIGEIIEMRGDRASIQVYEETTGIGPGDDVYSTGSPLSIELGPGMLEQMFDGIQRPLEALQAKAGDFLLRGVSVSPLDREKRWDFVPTVNVGDEVSEGNIIGTVQETTVVSHKIMVPPAVSGKIVEILPGYHTVDEIICKIETDDGIKELNMIQKWPVRRGRPYSRKLDPIRPLVTGQRIIDTFFPVASLMKGTVLIPNTSNMPVAAREASIYTGITIGEYFRDMGYSVALMADSTSRWAEALREMSGRLEEMPGDEGYPAYLASRVADFYERAGYVKCLGEDREGALTVIGAVSPPGGDISEPVSQATLRIVKVFWGLDYALSYRRHFPAINWLNSYSLYQDKMDKFMDESIDRKFSAHRIQSMALLQEESNLQEVVRLVGRDSLSETDQLKLEVAKSLREDFLQQNAFHEIDTYCSLPKQFKMLNLILGFYDEAKKALDSGVYLDEILKIESREGIARSKNIPENELEKFDELFETVKADIEKLISEGGNSNA